MLFPALKEVFLETALCHSIAFSVIKNVPLINDIVRCRIAEITEDGEASLCKLTILTEFSLQVDESTLPSNGA